MGSCSIVGGITSRTVRRDRNGHSRYNQRSVGPHWSSPIFQPQYFLGSTSPGSLGQHSGSFVEFAEPGERRTCSSRLRRFLEADRAKVHFTRRDHFDCRTRASNVSNSLRQSFLLNQSSDSRVPGAHRRLNLCDPSVQADPFSQLRRALQGVTA